MRLPQTLKTADPKSEMLDAFAYEAASEAASALGHLGRKLEAALEAIRQHDSQPGSNTDRDALVQEAADATLSLIIQREAFGLRASRDVVGFYNVPRDVVVRIGVSKPKANRSADQPEADQPG